MPDGPGTPFPDYGPAFETAVSECRNVRTLDSLVRLRGRGGGTHISGRLLAGLAAPASLRLVWLAPFGAPGFVLVARPGEATLWLTREARVLRDVPAADMLDSLTGVALAPEDLRAVLTGCLVPDAQPTAGRSYDDDDLVAVDLMGGSVAFLRRIGGEHHLVAGTRDGLTIEYGEFRRHIPRRVRVLSDELVAGSREPLTDLTATLFEPDINVDIPDEAFVLNDDDLPDDVLPMTLDDLRRVSPLEAPPEPSPSR
ncbi:MAG: hypothetical protein QF681_06360 [Vicinamibacterales bacterium]|nr:hypothetical protein [Vicinamibacterales bacterium]